jgi:putative endonuclease
MFYVYAIQSRHSDRIYIGHTKDFKKRLDEHNNGSTFSTKRDRPWDLIAFEEFQNRNDARLKEIQLKKSRGSRLSWLKRNSI